MKANTRSLQVAEAADLIGVSPDTLRRLADTGAIPSHRLPSSHRRFDLGDVLAFRKSLRRESPRSVRPSRTAKEDAREQEELWSIAAANLMADIIAGDES